MRAVVVLGASLLVVACESVPPARDAGTLDAGDDRVDAARAPDLAQHVVLLPPPTAIEIAYELVPTGAMAHVTWHRTSDPSATRVRVVRRAQSVPLGPFDPIAQAVYEGSAWEARQAVRELAALETSYYAAFSCDDAGGCEDAGIQKPFTVTLGQALLDGGYTIYLRHGSASLCADQLALGPAATTTSPGWWKSCDPLCGSATAAQLDASGAGAASLVGDALRSRAVPVGRVVTSEFCRARATAQALGLDPVIETSAALTYFVYDEAQRCASVHDSVAAAPLPGRNDVFVGHGDFPAVCDPLSSLAPADAAIYRAATATEPVRFVSTLTAAQWSALP